MADFRKLSGWWINRDRVEMAIVVHSATEEIESGEAESEWSIDVFLIGQAQPMEFWYESEEQATRDLCEFLEVANANGSN